MESYMWSCGACTYMNQNMRNTCDMCGSSRPTFAGSLPVYNAGYQHVPSVPQHHHTITAEGEIRIVIIGKTGTGKSATGNTILGRTNFESKVWGSSVTSKCRLGINVRFNRKLVVVDTPGLFDTGMTNENVTREIVKCIGMTAPGPHAILLTVNIGRFTKEEQDTVQHFVDHFGEEMYNYLMVVLTRADDLANENVDINDFVRNSPPTLQAVLQRCNNRFVAFNNKLTGIQQEQQVTKLIHSIDDVIRRNGGCCYTNEMYEEAEKTLQRREAEVKRKLQEEKQRQVEQLKSHLQSQYDARFAQERQERERLEANMQLIENEKRMADQRENDMRQQITQLRDQLTQSKMQAGENRNSENEKRLEIMIQEMERKQAEHIQMQMNKANEDKIAQLQRQMEDTERRRQKEIEDLKRENEQKVKEAEERCQKKTDEVRDDIRKDCEEEKDVLDEIIDGAKRVVKGAKDVAQGAVKAAKKVWDFFTK